MAVEVGRRLAAVWDMRVVDVRELAGRHEYDGRVQDLSPAGVAAGLSRLGQGEAPSDPRDAAHLAAVEAGVRAVFGRVGVHRRNPLVHVANLDVACYDREYAPAGERAEARRRHLAAWPDAVDAAVESLGQVPASVAVALQGAVAGLAVGLDDPADAPALRAHARLVAHLEHAAEHGDPDPALGAGDLAALLGDGEGLPVELAGLAATADAERDRLQGLLRESCERLAPGEAVGHVVAGLLSDHPSTPEEIYAEAAALVGEVTAFTVERGLLADPGGSCRVGPAPPSRSWATAMMYWAAPYEPDAPSLYYVTPPDPSWSAAERADWLAVFSRTTLPAITVHEVTPGHYAHGRALRRTTSDVRRSLYSDAFVEGWAHYAEELFVEEGFRADDPRFAIGVTVEALIRVTRLAVSIGVHTRAMDLEEAARRFTDDAFLRGPAARAEAARATFDPTYGRYTWGKLEILRTRDEARAIWGAEYSHRRFHDALLAAGAPPLGLLREALHNG